MIHVYILGNNKYVLYKWSVHLYCGLRVMCTVLDLGIIVEYIININMVV